MRQPPTPRHEAELLQRAYALDGLRLSQLSAFLRRRLPDGKAAQRKGLTGQLLDLWLGASRRHRVDFPHLGIELKSLPIGAGGRVRGSTFVTAAPAGASPGIKWERSEVFQKLSRVLWVPVEVPPEGAPPELARFLRAFLWSPSAEEAAQLRRDWEELTTCLTLNANGQIPAELGEWLQLRPKGRNRFSRTFGIDAAGGHAQLPTRGFYLRSSLTQMLFERASNPQQRHKGCRQ